MDLIEKIMYALDNNKIRVWQDANDDSAKCQIGDYWFYFYHIEDDDCLENWSTDETAERIAEVILDPEGNGIGDDETEYYKAFLNDMVNETVVSNGR